MDSLTGKLSDYVTVAMAVEMLGHSRDQTGRFYSLVAQGLPTYKLGGTTLAKTKDFTAIAGLPAGTSSLWPAELAGLQMNNLYSRNDTANLLNVAPRTVNSYANRGKITAYDLSPWGGHVVYRLSGNSAPSKQMKIADWTIKATLGNGKLTVRIQGSGTDNVDVIVEEQDEL